MQKPWSLYNKEDRLRIDDLTTAEVRIVLLATPTSRMGNWYACQEGDLHWQPVSAIPEYYEDVRQIKGRTAEEEEQERSAALVPPSLAPPAKPKTVLALAPEAQPVQHMTPADPRRPLFEDAEMSTKSTLQVENVSTKERRTARRYPRKLSFRLALQGKSFTTETVDVSMSGLSLAEKLPTWAPKTFKAELSMNNSVVRVLCARVGEKKLQIKEASSWDLIRAWIVNW